MRETLERMYDWIIHRCFLPSLMFLYFLFLICSASFYAILHLLWYILTDGTMGFHSIFCWCSKEKLYFARVWFSRPTMVVIWGLQGPLALAGRPRSFANLVSQTPQASPEVVVLFRHLQIMDGEVFLQFSKEELHKTTEPFKFSIIMKFLWQRPSLDRIRGFIHRRWGQTCQLVVSAMWRPPHVFVRFSNEEDFLKAMSRESCDVVGVF